MNIIVFVLVTVVCSINHGMTSGSCDDEFKEETDMTKESIIALINDYALRVLKSSFDTTKRNWFLFPINLVSVLSTLYLGSNGTFVDELETVWKLDQTSTIHSAFEDFWKSWDELAKSYTFETLDLILVNNDISINEAYKSNVTKYYPQSIIRNVSFPDSLNEINNDLWELTGIKRAVPEDYIAPETLLFLISAAYLNVRFDVGFNNIETRPFYLQDRNNMSIPHESMFVSNHFNYMRDDIALCDIVQLTMNNDDLRLFLVVPIKGKEIKEFYNNVESDILNSWIQTAGFERIKINLRMPAVSPRGVLPLKSMIVRTLFDKEAMDLSGMINDQTKLFADQYLQVGYTEYGDSLNVGNGTFDPNALSIEAVVPFVYFIVDARINVVILTGKYTHP